MLVFVHPIGNPYIVRTGYRNMRIFHLSMTRGRAEKVVATGLASELTTGRGSIIHMSAASAICQMTRSARRWTKSYRSSH